MYLQMDFSGAFILGGVLLAIFGAIFLCRGKSEEKLLKELKAIWPLPESIEQQLRHIHASLIEEIGRDKPHFLRSSVHGRKNSPSVRGVGGRDGERNYKSCTTRCKRS